MIINKNVLSTKIDQFLLDKEVENKQVRKEKNEREGVRFYPSSMGKCTRYIVFDMLGYPKTETPPKVLRIMRNGDSMHERYQKWFEDLGILIANEYPIKFPEYRISGRIDSIIKLDDLIPGCKDCAIVELKSANAKKCEYMVMNNKPNHEYVDQLQLYMHLLKIPQGIVMVENKNDQSVLEFWVEHDENYARRLIDKVVLVNHCVDTNTLPPRDYSPSSYQCSYCDFKASCRPS